MWEEYRAAMQSSRADEWRLYPRESKGWRTAPPGGVTPHLGEAVERLMAFGMTDDRGLAERALPAADGNLNAAVHALLNGNVPGPPPPPPSATAGFGVTTLGGGGGSMRFRAVTVPPGAPRPAGQPRTVDKVIQTPLSIFFMENP